MNYFAQVLESSPTVSLFDEPQDWLASHGINILIIIIGAWLSRLVVMSVITGLFNRAVRRHEFASNTDRKKRIETLDSLLGAVSKIIVFVIASVMVVDELGINTAPLLASAGVVGVALGIGAQSLIKDFVSGFFIITENQYRVGDVVTLVTPTTPVSGTVEAITVRATILRDVKGVKHHIPNGSVVVASNKTFGYSKLNELLVVDRGTDLKKLEQVINKVGEALAADETIGKLIKVTPTMAQVQGYNELGLAVYIRGTTKPGGQWDVQNALFKRLQNDLDKAGIQIATAPFSSGKKEA